MPNKSNAWGKEAEKIAMEYLVARGMPILEQNWSPAGGHKEIDIISRKDNFIIFVEVKARSGKDGDPIDAMTATKVRNLVRCADSYLRSVPGDHWEYRFDIIAITGNSEKHEIEHLEDAFLPPLKTFR